MSMFFVNPDAPTRINKVQINQAVLGYPFPVVMGKGKVQQSLLWIDGLTAKSVTQGGKGVGGGKGGSSWLYSADVIAALCNGPILGIGDVWAGQSWLSNNNTTETFTIAATYTPVNSTSGVFIDGGVGVQNTYSSSNTDLGSGGPVTISGTDLAPLSQVPFGTSLVSGKYSIDTSNVYHFAAADAGKTAQLTYTFALNIIKQQENDIVPSGLTIAVGGTFTYHADFGVKYFTGPNNGIALTRVSGTPATGQYSLSGRTYTFATGDIGAEVQITYQIQNNSAVPTGAPGRLNFAVFEGTQGQGVWSLLTSTYPQAALGYTNIAYVAYAPMTLGYAADVQQNVFEVLTPDAYGSGIVDCNPVRCILQVLTNTVWGLGAGAVPFPTSAIDNGASGSWGGPPAVAGARQSGANAWNWFAANNFFISPVIDHQDSAASIMSKWLEAGLCAAFMSEGLLKLVPYGDTSSAGNGCTWTAPTSFACALDDTCFVPKQEGEDPVKISSKPWQDAYNVVQVQWGNRSNQYAPEITPESDQAAINRYGSRIEDPQNWDFIRTLPAATFAANMRVKRGVYTRNTYEFPLPYSYAYLEPMDVVDITTSSQWAQGLNNANLGIVNLPVRITKIVDNPDGTLDITAEDYPFGVHQPTLYNKAIGAGQTQQNIFADPGDSEVVLFEATNRLSGYQGNQVWIGATGSSDDWGKCNIFVSQDGTTYKQVGTIDKQARLGVLASALASGTDPDTSHSLVVDLAVNSPALEAGTTTDADLDNTLCFVDGEIISYSANTVTGQEQYTMNGYLRRGQMGSTIGAHAAGTLFLRLDDAVFKFVYDPTWAGKTLFFKFQSVNTFGNSPQDLSTLTPVSFTVPGQNPGTIDASSGLVLNTSGAVVGAGPLPWTPIALTTDSTINYGNTVAGSSALPTGVNASYTYGRWVGYIIPSVTGQYTIGLNVDDGASLYLGGKAIISELGVIGGANSTTSYKFSDTILLTKGCYYPIVLEWQNTLGSFEIQLIWTPPGGSAQLIPSANLSTTKGAVTGNLSGSWWNGTKGLFFPGQGVIDFSNTQVSNVQVVGATIAVSNVITSPAGSGSYPLGAPAWIYGQAWSSNSIIDLFLPSVGNANAGYMIRFDYRSGFGLADIFKVTNITTSSWTLISTGYLGGNPSALTAWLNFGIYILGNGYMSVWVNDGLACDATDTTYAPTGAVQYGYEGAAGKLGPNPTAPGAGSTGLNNQGSIIPNQPISPPGYNSTTTSIAFTWSAQSMQLSDGSTVTIPAGSKTYSSLTPNTKYYFYPYIRCSDFTIQFANGSPPPTGVSSAFALAANSDGCFSMSTTQITTPASGTGGGGPPAQCPDSLELVDVQGRGIIPVSQVAAGDFIKGHSFQDGTDVYRRVVSFSSAPCAAWRIINGHKVSPCEPVWDGQAWTPAFKVAGGVFDGSVGIKIMLHVDCDEYEECNYYLVSGTQLLIHNMQIVS